jgi:hypothetical protein
MIKKKVNGILYVRSMLSTLIYLSTHTAHIPKEILECPAVSREVTFKSKYKIDNFHLEQKIIFEGMLMEGTVPFKYIFKGDCYKKSPELI